MSRIIGLDLGTTNSCVAAFTSEGARILSAPSGARTIPSTVAFVEDNILVGVAAERQAVQNPTRTFFGTKRLIGRKLADQTVQRFARTVPYSIVESENGDAWLAVDDDVRSPQEIAALVLQELKQIAEGQGGEPITKALITVPAYFDEAQRQATRAAGSLAGLEVVRLLNEPTAAALGYGVHRRQRSHRTIAVFDLGGGTFDISIMAVEGDLFEVRATNGDSALGGNDWDRRVVEMLVDEIRTRHGADVSDDPTALARLKEAAEQAKRLLSSQRTAAIHLPFLAGTGKDAINFERKLRREEFDAATQALTERLAGPCELAVTDAGLDFGDIDEVLLVGGMTRVRHIQQFVQKLFGRPPSKTTNPDEAVALGAATYAAVLDGTHDDATLVDVTSHAVGISVAGDFHLMLPSNAMLPARAREKVTTVANSDGAVELELMQDSEARSGQRRVLGTAAISSLQPGATVHLEVELTANVEGILSMRARTEGADDDAVIDLRPATGLSRDVFGKMVERRRRETADRSLYQLYSDNNDNTP